MTTRLRAWFSPRGTALASPLGRGTAGVELPPLPPASDDDFAPRRTPPWRLSDELPDLGPSALPEPEVLPEPTLVRDLLERRAALGAARVQRRRDGPPGGPPLIESWRDRERRGWLLSTFVLFVALTTVIALGVLAGLNRPVLPASVQAEARAADDPTGVADPERTSEPATALRDLARWREGFPIALGTVWLIGAWVLDREARRALVVRGVWRDRPTFAYGIVALLVVTPILFGGLLQIAWGVVGMLVRAGRSGDATAPWRGVAWMVGFVVTILVLHRPTAAGLRWLARTATQALHGRGEDPIERRRRARLAMIDEVRRRPSGSNWP